MTTVYLARHGRSTWNEKGIYQGKQDPPLSAHGCRQALALAGALADRPLVAIYSSPQQRARMTAEMVADRHGLPVTVLAELAEIDHGHWEGLTDGEIQQKFAHSYQTWVTQPGLTQMPGGEHCMGLQQRVLRAWQEILRRHSDPDEILVVSHDVPLKVIIAEVLGLELNAIGQLVLDNAALSIVREVGGRLRVVQLNDRCHLEQVISP